LFTNGIVDSRRYREKNIVSGSIIDQYFPSEVNRSK